MKICVKESSFEPCETSLSLHICGVGIIMGTLELFKSRIESSKVSSRVSILQSLFYVLSMQKPQVEQCRDSRNSSNNHARFYDNKTSHVSYETCLFTINKYVIYIFFLLYKLLLYLKTKLFLISLLFLCM